MKELLLIGLFIVSMVLGYKIIKEVPSLLHTPLMSGLNAIHGIPILGAMVAVGVAVMTETKWLGLIAVALASINIVGGFGVTHKMLRMFKTGEK
ncbi:hypothetical protein Desdi_0267 [Desulfitobacterium dichloroeliminans LMG P-21439]|uniref:proton-translocating NAD(P)(+) transhydrogenase n=1 Tax=Desulfitobacterium dichloroeliminans (strain LMG P-21439 / DCA1) TaxID=871963 RepID=L0F573_DESDL|nr:NAD(P) transhydrogenase subunit alpha [Desulfitobacterium dichloroeliminans]AGA67816.1 hypothetical protein Desdi_0267 [Desulfitobacterium dichloroeliminans LMG P-21439]